MQATDVRKVIFLSFLGIRRERKERISLSANTARVSCCHGIWELEEKVNGLFLFAVPTPAQVITAAAKQLLRGRA